LSSVVFLEP